MSLEDYELEPRIDHLFCSECGGHSRNCWCLGGIEGDYDEITPPEKYCPGGGDHD